LFTFNRFSQYLSRGIWIFLVQLILQMVVAIPLSFLSFAVMFVGMILARDTPGLAAVCWLPIMFISFVAGILVAIVQWPMNIYIGIRQKLEFGPMWTWTKAFAKSMYKEVAISLLFLMAFATILSPLGYLACCVGIFVVGAFAMMVQHHLQFQAYALYLERGGERVPERYPGGEVPGDAPSDAVPPAE
jgi:hypothetical protein